MVRYHQRFRLDIQESVPFSAWAPIRIFGFFPVIKINVICQVRISPTSTAVWAWRWIRVKCCMAPEDRGCILFAFVSTFVVGKNRIPPIWAQWLRQHYTGRHRSSGISGQNLWIPYRFHTLLVFFIQALKECGSIYFNKLHTYFWYHLLQEWC